MSLFGRRNGPRVPEIDVQGDEFTVRQPQGGEPESQEFPQDPAPARVPEVTERKGKIPPHSWGA